MAQSTTMTIRLEGDLRDRLDKLSAATHRSRSFLAAEAVREYVELNEWQVAEIADAVHEADAEDFATDDEVLAVLDKWTLDGD